MPRKTALYSQHAAAQARFVDFHGWDMPVQYRGILEETRCVRERGGIFDLCHMGRLVVEGPQREAFVDHVFSGSFANLKHGRAKYGFLLNEQGYPIDDVLVYRDVERVHIVINATGREKDLAWVKSRLGAKGFDATVREVSDEQAMIALQGRISEHVLQPLCGTDLSAVRYYAFTTAPVCGVPTLIARTGYTGEDGFEVFPPLAQASAVWEALVDSGSSLGLEPIGLGARDLLRLEAGMPLYGQEITTDIHPLEADLGFGVDLSKTATCGIPALLQAQRAGVGRCALSLAATGGRVPRPGYRVFHEDKDVGVVTSGGMSPTIGRGIARVLVDAAAQAAPQLVVEMRGQRFPMDVVPSPFYKRPRG